MRTPPRKVSKWRFKIWSNEDHMVFFFYAPWISFEFDCGYAWVDWVEYLWKQGWRVIFSVGRFHYYWGKEQYADAPFKAR